MDFQFCMCILHGWFGEAKVSCSFCHQGAQLILAYSWAKPAVLAAGKGIEGMMFFSVPSLISLFLPYPSLSSSLLIISLLYYFLPFSGRQHKMTHKG